jgi:hypothetical protein
MLSDFAGNPYSFAGRRPFREARLRAYIAREHRAGRSLLSILDDPYIRRCGGQGLCDRVLENPRMIALLERDVEDAIKEAMATRV